MGLVFIYYYGLEFRAIFEGKDQKEILKEVIRLHEIYQFNNSFRGYSEGFIAWLVLSIDNLTNEEKSHVLKITEKADSYSDLNRWGIPFNIQKKITAKGFTNLVASFPKTPRSKIPDKLGQLFKEHFISQIKKDWPSIQKTIKVKKTLFQYHCATRIGHMFQKNCLAEAKTLDIPTKLQSKLSRIWSQCIEDLRAYSRRAGKTSEEELHSLLPDDLKRHHKHPLEDSIQNALKGNIGNPIVMGTFLEGIGRSYSPKLSLKDSKVLCETFEHLKINIEPDARDSQKSYKWDQHVVFYKTPTAGIPKGSNYSTACWLFDLGVGIANADNQIDDEELDVVEEFVSKKFCQTPEEKERVKHRKKLASAGALKGKGVAKKLAKRLTGYELKPVGEYLFAIAAADGNISPDELIVIKKIFKDFGLKEDTYNSLLNEFLPSNISSQPTVIQKKATIKQTGSSIPQPDLEKRPPDQSKNLVLDKEALNRIWQNTYEVKEILEKTFNSENPPEDPIETAENTETNNLTGNIKIFYDKIIQKTVWDKQELRQLAQELDLMLNSTIDHINHWADQTYGDYLIYEDEGFSIQKDLVQGAYA